MSSPSRQRIVRPSYMPRPWARTLHASPLRWKVIVAHRRAGKTTAALNHLIISAARDDNAGRRYAFIAPTYKQAKNVAWDILKRNAREIPGTECRETEIAVRFWNGSSITLFGADTPDRLRGMGLAGVVFDEYSQQPSNIFTEIVRPMLSDTQGYAIWIGTPKGRNEFWRLFEKAQQEPEWLAMKLTVTDTDVISSAELADAKKSMSEDEFLQEWYCSFDASIKGSVYGRELATLRQSGRIGVVPHRPEEQVHTVWDLGVGAALAVGFFQKVEQHLNLIDYWQGTDRESLPDAIRVVKNKPYVLGKHFAPHDIQTRDIGSGNTRLNIAAGLGIKFTIVPSIPIADGIEKAKLLIARLWVDEKNCQLWLDAITQYQRVWDDARGMFKDEPYHDWTSHAADVLRYAAVAESQMQKRVPYRQSPPPPPPSDYHGGW